MDEKKKTGGSMILPAMLVTVVPSLVLSCLLAFKGKFLGDWMVTALKALCALAAVLSAVVIFSRRQPEAERGRQAFMSICCKAALYMLAFTLIGAFRFLAEKLLDPRIAPSPMQAVPAIIAGILQAALLPAFLLRMNSPSGTKHANPVKYLVCALLCLGAGLVLQAEDAALLLFGKTVSYLSIAVSFALMFVKALLGGLLLDLCIKRLDKVETKLDLGYKNPGLGKVLLICLMVVACTAAGKLFETKSSYQLIKDDLDQYIKEGQTYLQGGSIDAAEFAFSKAENRIDGWLSLLDGSSASTAYERYSKDLGMLIISSANYDNLGRAEDGLRNNPVHPQLNEAVFYLLDGIKEEYYLDTLTFLAANGRYTRSFPLLSDLKDNQKKELKEYLESYSDIHPLCDMLRYTQQYGRTGEFQDLSKIKDLGLNNQDNLYIQYYAAKCFCLAITDHMSYKEECSLFIGNYVSLTEKECAGDEESIMYAKEEALEMYMTIADYESAEILARSMNYSDKDKQNNLNLLKLACLDMQDKFDECAVLAKSMISEGSASPQAYYYAGVSAVKAGEKQDALSYFKDMCGLLKPDMTAEKSYEIEEEMYILAMYIAVKDEGSWTDYTYSFYEELSEEEKAILSDDALALNYLEGIYYVFERNDLEPAIKALDSVTDAYPNLPLAWYLKGAVYYDEQEFDKAAEMMEKSQALKSDIPAVKYGLANVYDAQGRLEEAYDLTAWVYNKISTVNHEKDWYGLGVHNANLMNDLKRAIAEKNGGAQQ